MTNNIEGVVVLQPFELTNDEIDSLVFWASKHAEVYPDIALSGIHWESILNRVKPDPNWVPNNHSEEGDLHEHSLKSGTIDNSFLTFSSHRTTKYETLQDKLDYLKSKKYKGYLCLSREKKSEKIHSYKLIHIPREKIDFDSLTWENIYGKRGKKKGKLVGYRGKNLDNTIVVKIQFSMSDQVWIDIDMNSVTIIREFDF
jgi:hypothetical protein